jgi:hypothetical protein
VSNLPFQHIRRGFELLQLRECDFTVQYLSIPALRMIQYARHCTHPKLQAREIIWSCEQMICLQCFNRSINTILQLISSRQKRRKYLDRERRSPSLKAMVQRRACQEHSPKVSRIFGGTPSHANKWCQPTAETRLANVRPFAWAVEVSRKTERSELSAMTNHPGAGSYDN